MGRPPVSCDLIRWTGSGAPRRFCDDLRVDYPNDQAPGAPVRSGIPEHGRIPKYYAVKAQIAVLLDELGRAA